MSAKLEFSIDKIGVMDELMGANINLRLQDALRDIYDRPLVEGARKLALNISLEPMVHDGRLYKVAVAIDVKATLPADKSVVHALPFKGGGEMALMFEPLSPLDPHQGTFETLEQEAGGGTNTIKMPRNGTHDA